ncbi:MAG: Asp-tRNA(Asn)/Glu-tRNA(Gln) amidotransferase subunit GatB [Proteobacteria bacterium]|nr:Asp-tRNA(Asn)/Glu-tRNA(Gln) amidotransferase subunit GatB [Pseudomonadota bacterium]MDA1059001.1 Asp-tRNA(Asn)/Glu-tRNA(Gln) amidotransferase subunit GatB [Pseudomonadota bacterium]
MSGTIQGATGTWEMVIGLEVHAQITSNSKLFSGASTAFGAEPNTQVGLVDAAMPGMLPVINKVCVEQAVRTGLGLKAQINLRSVFDRKNYFYPDLPQGYQISQFLQPVVGAGTVVLDMDDGRTREIGITRLHLEQDAGKSVHDLSPDRTYVDLNRSGIALMEIVSEPDLRSSEEAGAYLRKLRSILRYLGTCDGNMEQGSMRADVNVSVRRPGADYGTRCEIKNVNSVRFVQQAIEYEAQRQVDILEEGGVIAQQTRLFDSRKGETRSMRSKEEAHDYRYFPDPDLLPLEFTQAWVDEIASSLPELPDDRKARFVGELGLSPYDAGVLVAEKEVAEFFEEAARDRDAKAVANWIMGDLFGALNKSGLDIARSPISAAHLGALVDLIADDTISGRIAKDVFDEMMKTGRPPAEIVDQRGLRQVTDSGAIEAIVDAVMESNPDKVAEYRGGKDRLFGFFVGQVMKQSQGKANPKIVNDLLQQKLSG